MNQLTKLAGILNKKIKNSARKARKSARQFEIQHQREMMVKRTAYVEILAIVEELRSEAEMDAQIAEWSGSSAPLDANDPSSATCAGDRRGAQRDERKTQ